MLIAPLVASISPFGGGGRAKNLYHFALSLVPGLTYCRADHTLVPVAGSGQVPLASNRITRLSSE